MSPKGHPEGQHPSAGHEGAPPALALRALLATLAIQVFVSLAAVAVPVLAPVIAPDAGVSTALLGVFVGALYAVSMFSGLLSGTFIERHGAIRVSQFAVVMATLGLAAAAGPLALLAAAALVIGAGYGCVTPASSHILVRTTPPERMALMFSLKQTGVPLGAALAGMLLPVLSLAVGWRSALLALAATGVLIVVAAQAIRPALDTGLEPERRLSVGRVLGPLRTIAGEPRLRELCRTGMFYALAQACLMSFLVAFLTAEAGMTLIAAGLGLTVLNAFAVAGRIAFGGVADRWAAPRRVLGWLGIVSGACGFAMVAVDARWPAPALLFLVAVYGAAAIGWNGVHLSEIARAAPAGQAGPLTGASGFFTFSGVMIGPPLFGALAAYSGSYRWGFALIGVSSLANGWALLKRSRR